MQTAAEQDVGPACLDRPVWAALTSHHAGFAVSAGPALMYHDDVAPFAAFDPASARGHAALLRAVRARPGGIALIQADDVTVPDGLVCAQRAMGVQMRLERPLPKADAPDLAQLSEADVPDMLELVRQTEPGPFGARTHELGAYWGLRRGGALVAMAGERMRLPGHCEISAVCVHPDHRGRGYARQLVIRVAEGILARGEVPILHAFADNAPAIRLYDDMGFRLVRRMHVAMLAAAEA
ncbi:MAG: GNAT family N-acetyltransferase [Pseudomonadota bacterium]